MTTSSEKSTLPPGFSLPAKPILAVDFEPIVYPGDHKKTAELATGVWPLDQPPQPDIFGFLEQALEFFTIHIITWRADRYSLQRWWKRFGWTCDNTGKPDGIEMKERLVPGTHIYLASRVFLWKGIFPSPIELTKFVPYPQSEERGK